MYSLLKINKCVLKNYRTTSVLSKLSNYHYLTHKYSDIDSKIHICMNSAQVSYRKFSLTEIYVSVSQSYSVQTVQNFLVDLHQATTLPWWSIIFLSTLCLRTFIVFPLAIHQNQVISRLSNIQQEIHKLVPELNKEVNIARRMYNWDEAYAKKFFKIQLRKLNNKFVIRDNCHPTKIILLGLIQIPVWIVFSFSLRNLTMISTLENAPVDIVQLKYQGLLWFPDLTCPDSIFIPFLLLAVNLTLTELHVLRRMGKGNFLQNCLLYMSRVMAVFLAAVATLNPTSVTFYWLSSSTIGLAQSVLLMHPKVKRKLGIPPLPNESSTPYTDIANNFRKRFMKS